MGKYRGGLKYIIIIIIIITLYGTTGVLLVAEGQ